jgi:cyclase
MIKPRVIARLDIKGDSLIKGIHLEGLRKIGDPNEYAFKYYKQGADEILLMDVVASLYGRNNLFEVIKKAAKNIFIPITVGGGVRSEENVESLLHSGADKVCINTAAVKNPKLISRLAKRFGSQCIVLSVEAKKISQNNWEAYTHNGREKTNLDVKDWVKKAINFGVGEVILTSVDYEGTGEGFDYKLCEEVSKICSVPLIFSGGLGNIDHIKNLSKIVNIDAIATARAIHYNKLKVSKIKKQLS